MKEIKAGSVVKQKNNFIKMTVNEITKDKVECIFFDDSRVLNKKVYNVNELELI